MTQALFEVQTFDGHGWVTLHRGTDLDAAGESARGVLPEAKKRAVRIVRQSFDLERSALDRQVVFSLGKPRKPVFRRVLGVAAAFSATLAAIVAASMIDQADPDALVALVAETPAAESLSRETPAGETSRPALSPLAAPILFAAAAPALIEPAAPPTTVVPSAGDAAFDCEREAARGLVRASTIAPARERLYALCAEAVEGSAEAQMALAASLADGDAAPPDPAQAVRWYQEAARDGVVAAYRPLADLLLATAGADSDRDRAIAWYHRAALAGDVVAAADLARRYRAGDAVAADERVALSYDLIAAEAGDAPAMLRAADAFAAGLGTEVDRQAAERWLARAAEAQPMPAILWSAPILADAGPATAPDSVPVMSWTAPASAFGLEPNPDLRFEYDRDARELGNGFADAKSYASV